MSGSEEKRDVTKTGNGERGTGNGERGTGNGDRERGPGTGNGERGAGNEHVERKNEKTETKQRIGNENTDRARAQVRFCSHFSFSPSPLLFPDPRSQFKLHPEKKTNRKTNNKILCFTSYNNGKNVQKSVMHVQKLLFC